MYVFGNVYITKHFLKSYFYLRKSSITGFVLPKMQLKIKHVMYYVIGIYCYFVIPLYVLCYWYLLLVCNPFTCIMLLVFIVSL